MTPYMVSQGSNMCLDDIKNSLHTNRASLRCSDVTKFLEQLGFTVRQAGDAGHRVFMHKDLKDFHGSNFNCGHGSNAEVKKSYIRTILRIIEQHEDQLRELLKGKK